jgi:hypothetical protein
MDQAYLLPFVGCGNSFYVKLKTYYEAEKLGFTICLGCFALLKLDVKPL